MKSHTLIAHCFILALLVIIPSPSHTFAQTTDSLHPALVRPQVIDTVFVFGNLKTKEYVILNEMTLRPGMIAAPEQMEFDRARIYSLGLFTRVDVEFQRIDTAGYLIVDVSERWYIIPLPILGFRDGDPKKLYYGAGLIHDNFRGANQKLFAEFTLGYDPSLILAFQDPLIDPQNSLSFSAELSATTIRNRSVLESNITGDFDEHHYDAGVWLGKRLSLYETVGAGVAYNVVSVTNYRPGRTASPTGRDAFVSASASYSYDSRDLREYAMRGVLVATSVTQNGFGESHVSFTRYGIDVRPFFPLTRDVTLASRAYASAVTGGTVPTYARTFIGYVDRVRGYYGTTVEGDDDAGGTLELRIMILRARTIDMTFLPVPEEFARWRFGIALALFADAGTAWFRGKELKLESFASGYGAGVHFLLPYGFIARVEYALNDLGKGQVIFDLRGSI